MKPLFILTIGLLFICHCAFAEGVANDLSDSNQTEIENVESQNVESEQASDNESTNQNGNRRS